MRQLISHFGLSFDLFELQDTLNYEHIRSGRPPKSSEISENDMEMPSTTMLMILALLRLSRWGSKQAPGVYGYSRTMDIFK